MRSDATLGHDMHTGKQRRGLERINGIYEGCVQAESAGKDHLDDDEGSECSPPLRKGIFCFRLHLSLETSII